MQISISEFFSRQLDPRRMECVIHSALWLSPQQSSLETGSFSRTVWGDMAMGAAKASAFLPETSKVQEDATSHHSCSHWSWNSLFSSDGQRWLSCPSAPGHSDSSRHKEESFYPWRFSQELHPSFTDLPMNPPPWQPSWVRTAAKASLTSTTVPQWTNGHEFGLLLPARWISLESLALPFSICLLSGPHYAHLKHEMEMGPLPPPGSSVNLPDCPFPLPLPRNHQALRKLNILEQGGRVTWEGHLLTEIRSRQCLVVYSRGVKESDKPSFLTYHL